MTSDRIRGAFLREEEKPHWKGNTCFSSSCPVNKVSHGSPGHVFLLDCELISANTLSFSSRPVKVASSSNLQFDVAWLSKSLWKWNSGIDHTMFSTVILAICWNIISNWHCYSGQYWMISCHCPIRGVYACVCLSFSICTLLFALFGTWELWLLEMQSLSQQDSQSSLWRMRNSFHSLTRWGMAGGWW